LVSGRHAAFPIVISPHSDAGQFIKALLQAMDLPNFAELICYRGFSVEPREQGWLGALDMYLLLFEKVM